MTHSIPEATIDAKTPLLRGGISFWFIALFACVLWGGEYLHRELWEPDEARYAYVAREMRDAGNWAVPHRHGEYYAHKPPLMFWLINGFSLVTGGEINSVSTRLPSLMGVIMALWAMTRLATAWFGTRVAWRSLIILSTSYLFWAKGGMGQIDALLCGLEMMALYFLFTDQEKPSWSKQVAAYSFMGLAILAKGPVGFLVPLGVYLCCTVGTKGIRSLYRGHLLWGPLLTLAFPGAWLLWVWHSGAPEGYLDELLFKQNVGRAAGSLGHIKPFYYYLEFFPIALLPWTFFLPLIYKQWKTDAADQLPIKRLCIWVVFVIAFFSLSASKRELYILLVSPAAAILLAASFDRVRESLVVTRWVVPVFFGILSVVLAAATYIPEIWEVPLRSWMLVPNAMVALATALILHKLSYSRRIHHAYCATMGVAMMLNLLCVSNIIYPSFNKIKTPQVLIQAAEQHVPEGQPLLLYKMNGEIMALYARRPGRYINDVPELLSAMAEQPHGLIILRDRYWSEIPKSVKARVQRHHFQMGSKTIYWLSF